MSKSSYALAQKTRYRITLDLSTSNKMDQLIDLEKIKWHKLLDLQSGEKVSVEVEKYNSIYSNEMGYIITLDLIALDDFDPYQIKWNRLIEGWMIENGSQKNRITKSKSYVEVLDAPYSW